MRADLAERLLAKGFGWTPSIHAKEEADLQALANCKSDDYQQFSPRMRIVESLALWLRQVKSLQHRQIAYDFIKSRLDLCSTAEINHLVGTS